MTTRRDVLRGLLGSSTLLALAACTSAAPTTAPPAAAPPTPAPTLPPTAAPTVAPSLTPITISFSDRTTSDLALFLAKEAGLFEQQGLDADLQFIASNTGIPALTS